MNYSRRAAGPGGGWYARVSTFARRPKPRPHTTENAPEYGGEAGGRDRRRGIRGPGNDIPGDVLKSNPAPDNDRDGMIYAAFAAGVESTS